MAQIYWETQESGFCGVHCTNNLLQGAYFTEVDFSTIALEMDEAEKKLMMEMGTETREFLKYMAQDSENVNAGGNFSIQVLEKAMGIMNLKIAPFQVSATSDPTTQDALVCNLENHWFSLRKINGHWFNLNSLQKDGPTLIGNFYLSAFLQQLQEEKYSIFAVTGEFPRTGHTLGGRGEWFPMATILARKPVEAPKQSLATRVTNSIMATRPNNNDSGDADLQRALKESMKEVDRRSNVRAAPSPASQAGRGNLRNYPSSDSDDADLALALALSRNQK